MTPGLKRTLAVVALLHLLILAAAFVGPYDGTVQDREHTFAPPTPLRFFDAEGRFHPWPFVYALKADAERFGEYREDPARAYPLRFLVQGAEYQLLGLFRTRIHLFGVDEPAKIFLLGTDQFGRDQFSRLLAGGQTSLLAGLVAATLSVLGGGLLGAAAGFFGRAADTIIMRLADIFLALPWLYLLFAIRAFLPLQLDPEATLYLLTAVIGAVGWARPARLVRGIVLSAKERNFVLASRQFGASEFYLLRRHILPQVHGVLLTQATLLIPQYVLAEVTLSFVGLGVGEPSASWGTMLAALQQYHVLQSYWWMFLPAGLMVMVFASYFVLAGHLQSRLKSSQF